MSTKVIGVGIIGYGPGSAAQTFHVPLINHETRLKIHTVSTLMPDVVKPLLPDICVVAEAIEVINDPKVQLVIVATPNAWHYEYTRLALEAGKHVIVEKPIAITVAEVDELIGLAKSKGVLLSQFHNRRWDGGFLTVQKLLDEKRLGLLHVFEMNYDRFEPVLSGNWREEKQPGNGILYDLGVHLLDQTLALFGRPDSVTASVLSQRESSKADDYFHIQLSYGSMQTILGANLFASLPGPRYRLCGSKGSFVKTGAAIQDPQAGMLSAGMRPGDKGWGEDEQELYGTFNDGIQSTRIKTVTGAYQTFYHRIADAILDGKPLPAPVETARDIIAIIEASYRSQQEGRRIPANEIGFLLPPGAAVVQ